MAVWLQAIVTLAPTTTCRHLAEWLSHRGQTDISSRGGHLWGLWDGGSGQGFDSNEAILMSVWPDDASAGAAVELMKAIPAVIAVSATPLHPTLRPQHNRPVFGTGLWVFRDFHLPAAELNDFLDQSAAAWEAFEAAADSEVLGLFRCPNEDAKTASLLLITRHANLATREASHTDNFAPGVIEQINGGHTPTLWSRTRSATLQPLPGKT